MRFLLLILLINLGGCATKYLLPVNRFITPETQGGFLNTQFEIQQTKAHQLAIISDGGNVNQGVVYSDISRTGYMFSTAFFDSFDFVWSHVGNANSMLGGKVQFIGGSRSAKAAGHKLGAAYLLGGNEHQTEDKAITFRMDGQELLLLYGYRINEYFLPYASLGRSSYHFDGEISSSNPSLNGKKPSYKSSINQLNGGLELDWQAFFAKLELSYQQISTDQTASKTSLQYCLSAGFNW
jgi:hypothetical protein